MPDSPIIEYTNLLHRHGSPAAPPVVAFLNEHAADRQFVKRAKALNRLFLMNPERARAATREPRSRRKV